MPLPSMAPLRQASMNSTLVPGTVSKMRRISRAVMPTSETPSDSSSCKSPVCHAALPYAVGADIEIAHILFRGAVKGLCHRLGKGVHGSDVVQVGNQLVQVHGATAEGLRHLAYVVGRGRRRGGRERKESKPMTSARRTLSALAVGRSSRSNASVSSPCASRFPMPLPPFQTMITYFTPY